MGFREWANKHQKLFATIVGGLVILMIGVVVIEAFAGRRGYPRGVPDSYFTDDDGKTFFVASSDHYPPFDHNGRPAVHAFVFQSNGKKFVGFLERYLPDVKAKLEAGRHLTPEMARSGRELKRPGETAWTRTGNPLTENPIQDVKAPDGGAGVPDEIEP